MVKPSTCFEIIFRKITFLFCCITFYHYFHLNHIDENNETLTHFTKIYIHRMMILIAQNLGISNSPNLKLFELPALSIGLSYRPEVCMHVPESQESQTWTSLVRASGDGGAQELGKDVNFRWISCDCPCLMTQASEGTWNSEVILPEFWREFYFFRDLRKFKDAKKQFEKVSEEKENALVKNAQVQRNKQHEVEEATNILTATRKCFRHIALDYVLQVWSRPPASCLPAVVT